MLEHLQSEPPKDAENKPLIRRLREDILERSSVVNGVLIWNGKEDPVSPDLLNAACCPPTKEQIKAYWAQWIF